MIQYGRDKMLACAASVKAIDDWPERAYASSLGYGDVDDGSAGLAKRTRERSLMITPEKRKSRWRSTIGPSTSHIETSSTDPYI